MAFRRHIAPAIRLVQRAVVLCLAMTAWLTADIAAAHAQSASCANLVATLRTLERNPEFRAYQSRADDLRQVQRQLQQVESRYVRRGCNDDAKARRPLNAECRGLARQITAGREQLQGLEQSVQTGEAVAQQREAVLQEIARFDCGGGSSRSRVTEENEGRGNLFDELFDMLNGGGQEDIRGEDFYGYEGYQTVRTVCVRSCDGYFWPVSYSTLPEYAGNDAQQCQSQCPGAEVQLYYYNNPGQEPEQMVSLMGEPYATLPNAFRYQREFDSSCTCKAPLNYGQINLAQTEGGQSRAVIEFGQQTFPLPLRDPRRPASVVEAAPSAVATYVTVPLPRRRPAAPGEQPGPVPVPANPVATAPEQRIVRFGNKTVRIVGPDTPYAPTASEGT